jgi:ssDNA-binding Zn-finger/Zn-ribbon topoisomerase 1
MALVTCPNCGKQASNKAQKCFICGYETLNLVAPPKKESQTTQVTTRITPPTITPPTIDESQIRCPKCSSTQIIANKKGWLNRCFGEVSQRKKLLILYRNL